ncbi:YppE family protein [Mesobacillus maritimus]|uniref:YppE family protein n=1 Tax=Mesobacillus maritimus TaxID=1643336 RepID=UPI0020421652|nr:YppE family protein [Mesobacillus maritimus]MCM3669426.1 YppE family protein [Mesobacillus maritimus]
MKTPRELLDMTKSLMRENQFIKERFEQAKESQVEGDFYQEVKPYADEIKQLTEIWRDEFVSWLAEHPQKNLHHQQIKTVTDNIQMVSIQAFFPRTSRKRFVDHVQSIEYTLSVVQSVLGEHVSEQKN